MKKTITVILIVLVVVVIGLYGYGYQKGSTQLKNGELSILTAAITIKGMNPISKEGYRKFITTRTDMPQKLNDLDN